MPEPILDENNAIVRIAGIAEDISDRMKNEEVRENLALQLQQAQKMESIGQLTGGIAHDFNNILASIMGYTDLALEYCSAEGQESLHRYMEEVFKSSTRARDLIKQMLAFSRGSNIQPQPLQVNTLIEESLQMLSSTLPSSIELITDIDTNVPLTKSDAVQLNQVIMNLCINARDALNNTGKLFISLHNTPNISERCSSCHKSFTGNYIEVAIKDNGPGIDPNIVERIFEPFFTTKETGKGTGMGLSMVHGIIHEHGGHVKVSANSSGTEFRLILPALEDDTILEKISTAESVDTASLSNLNRNILVVDDEISVANLISEILKKRGGNITTATDSRTALNLIQSDPNAYDLMITDHTMPGITGLNLSEKVFNIRPDLPIILCTGYSIDIQNEEVAQFGIKSVLMKPVSKDMLYNTVRNIFSQ